MNEFVVEPEFEGERLDKVLPKVIEGYSRSYLSSLLRDGEVLLNGVKVRPSAKVKEGDHVFFTIPEKIVPDILPENIPLDILYEDADVLVVNKPKGMVVHPAPGHYSGTLVNAVMYHCGDSLSGINGVLRPGIVHRIDRDTTGSVIICKNDAAHQSIAAQLKDHTITRRYLAICRGVLSEEELTVDAPLGRDPKDRKKMAVVPGGKHAVTHVKVLQRYRDATYIECRLETGRTHQIRVHLAHLGHPLLGDTVYGGAKNNPYHLEGQCLHAWILGFVHPTTGEYIETKAPLPAYFQRLLDTLPRA
ncbi:MAG: RluA family pseudouridine synthase [Lachnospiraceae bacterium]